MPSSCALQRILFIIVIIGAATGQRRQFRDQYEHAPAHLIPQLQDYTTPQFSHYANAHYTMPNEQYTNSNPTAATQAHRYQNFEKGNGNSLAAREIAMEILRDTFPLNIENANDVTEYYYQRPSIQKDSFDFLDKEYNNFRRSIVPLTSENTRKMQEQMKLIAKNPNWHENALSYDDDDDAAADDNNENENDATHVVYDNGWNYDTNGTNESVEYESGVKGLKRNAADVLENSVDISLRSDNELDAGKENLWNKIPIKRNPVATGNFRRSLTQPRYPFAFFKKSSGSDDKRNDAKVRSNKRERMRHLRTTFIPSISTGAMAHLGHFFNDLSNNVRYNERNEFREADAKLLHGDHPLRMLQNDVADEPDEQSKIDKTAEFLHAIRSYRPSQKIRSLVSMNPQGYHGSNFLDPNYMWVGLG